MLKPTLPRVVWALVCGFCLILVAAWFSGSTGDICKESNTGYEQCTPYNLIPFILIQIREGLHSIEGIIAALATIAIAWFTWTLRQSTEKMWIETKKAANAADLSAKAVTIVEFPIIRSAWVGPELLYVDELVGLDKPYEGVPNHGPPTKFSAIAEVEYHNYGRSPAFPVGILVGYTVADKLPEIPVYRKIGHPAPSAVVKERDVGKIETHFGFELSDIERTQIAESKAVLWFYILMTYIDIMDRPHEIGSCWQWGKQKPADDIMYFFDNGTAPAAYTKRI
jgi:hypothetical protein